MSKFKSLLCAISDLARRLAFAGMLLGLAAVAVPGAADAQSAAVDAQVIRPQSAQRAAESAAGGQITRSETLDRARDWYTRNPPLRYDRSREPNTLVTDVDGGHKYGPDCSGMVSMAWHLRPGQYGGLNTSSLPSVSHAINRNDLLPGDILDDIGDGHVVLFEAWEPDHVHFSYYSFGGNPMRHYTHAAFNDTSLAGHPTGHYAAYRYNNIVDGLSGVNGVVSGDVTGDGRADLVARKPDGTLWLYTNGGSDTAPFSTGSQIGTAWQQFGWFLAGDVTGDGRADIVAARPDGTLWLYVNGGSDSAPFSTGSQIGTAWQQFRNITLADVTGDERADLVAARPDGTLWLYVNGGSDSAPFSTGSQIGTAWQQFSWVLGGDVTGDGRADIVAARPDGTLWLYVNGGSDSAPFSTGSQIGTAWQQFDRILVGDVTGDSRTDVVASRPDGTLWLYANGGSNSAPYSTGSQIGIGWQIFA